MVNTKINCFKFIPFYFKSYYIKGDGSLYKLLCWIVTTLGTTTEDQTFHFSSNSGTCSIGLRWSRVCMEVLCGGVLIVYISEQRLSHLCHMSISVTFGVCVSSCREYNEESGQRKSGLKFYFFFWTFGFNWTLINFIGIDLKMIIESKECFWKFKYI